jgi:hypothetical protein
MNLVNKRMAMALVVFFLAVMRCPTVMARQASEQNAAKHLTVNKQPSCLR